MLVLAALDDPDDEPVDEIQGVLIMGLMTPPPPLDSMVGSASTKN
jgi:hypothetical protein